MNDDEDKLTSEKMNLQMRWTPDFVQRIDSVLEKVRQDFPSLSRHDLIFQWVKERLEREEKKARKE